MKKKALTFLKSAAWNLWCTATVVGIWPRFIEPKLLKTTRLNIAIPNLPKELEGLRILQFSDLHISPSTPDRFIRKLIRTAESLQPDIIVFTGDFINYAKVDDPERLKHLLNALEAPYGCYAILGNHDYASAVSINREGDYDILFKNDDDSVLRGIMRILKPTQLSKRSTDEAKQVPLNRELIDIIQHSPFKLLHNETCVIPIKGSCLNICGLGEYMLGQALPEMAYKLYDKRYPGLILAHNPDSLSLLKDYPGDLILCGHTHGSQINLPWVRKRITILENEKIYRGLYHIDGRPVYVNRGVGATLAFRWCAPPEVSLFTLLNRSTEELR